MLDVVALSKQLINIPSVTPAGEKCFDVIKPILEQLGFTVEIFKFGPAANLWAKRGKRKPLVCFLGHVDVVPTGDENQWQTPPFQATEKDGVLYGRGACDMKTGVAAMIVAVEKFITEHADHIGSIAFMITTAEEDMDEFGVPNVIKILAQRNEQIDYCVTGEPSSTETVGDTIRNGRRGSLSAKLTIKGKQGHVAFPQFADNPIHKAFAALENLVRIEWDKGNEAFPPTSLQFSNIHAGTGVGNVIPGELVADFNFRFSTELTAEKIQKGVEYILQKHKLDYDIDWHCSGQPFYTQPGTLTTAAAVAVERVCGIKPAFSTGGGTSDARFIAPTGAEVIELGVSNKTAHKVDECVSIADLQKLPEIHYEILKGLLLISK